ncbi:hypothetical protein [Streptomyces sp. 7N604]|uniref:hypothetical protein n=1 Tax=Streptomyces sp. 7N604 TaxID=3457415 RepID=UPI003FD1319C
MRRFIRPFSIIRPNWTLTWKAPEPAPGTEYPFSISDIARAAAVLLGDDWAVESGYWGVTGTLESPDGEVFTVGVDGNGDLYVCRDLTYLTTKTIYLPDLTAADGLDASATAIAEAALSLS